MLVPAYHHGSEVQALIDAGLDCRFYDGDAQLAPDAEELERLLDGRVRALYLIHTLGFPQDSARWRRWCDDRGLLLIEDAAQAWLAHDGSRPVGSLGDLAVFCLYKTFGLPEGAAVIQRSPAPAVRLDPRWGAVPMLRRHGSWLAGRSGQVWTLRKRTRRTPELTESDGGADFSLRDPTVGPWAHTPYLLRRVVDPTAPRRRRQHYDTLLEALGHLVPAPFDVLPPGASPFAFPVTVADKAAVRAHALAEDISLLDVWARPHPTLPADAFPRALARRAHTIALPVHQELRVEDLQRMARVVLDATAGQRTDGRP